MLVYVCNLSGAANESEYLIEIPGFVLCGSGSGAHYEYEITISLDTDKWSILRRYSRFREMHLAMKRLYGDAVSGIVHVQTVYMCTRLNSLLNSIKCFFIHGKMHTL